MDSQRMVLLEDDSERSFFKNVRSYGSKERPKLFDIRDVLTGKSNLECAEHLAAHFNAVSNEFSPLEPSDIPVTHHRSIECLSPFQVAGRLRAFRKPKSMVRGDLFPRLVTRCADFLAIPLTDVYNEVTSSGVWPITWKKEHVSVIPKCSVPSSLHDLRNISCTLLVSKVLESYVLGWAMEEVKIKRNQYGGVKGCGPAHLMIEVWQGVCEDLEDSRAATLLTSVDYAKAFNRVSFQHCLRSFASHGASTEIIRLLATFLSNRTICLLYTSPSPRDS